MGVVLGTQPGAHCWKEEASLRDLCWGWVTLKDWGCRATEQGQGTPERLCPSGDPCWSRKALRSQDRGEKGKRGRRSSRKPSCWDSTILDYLLSFHSRKASKMCCESKRSQEERGTGLKPSVGSRYERCFPQCLFNCLSSCFSEYLNQ